MSQIMDFGLHFMDLHNHTIWSDGTNSIEEVIGNAIRHNIEAVGITDHFNTHKCPSIRPEGIDDYIKEIQRLKGLYSNKIKVYAGIEICSVPFPSSFENLPFDKLNQLDYVLLEYIDYLSPIIKLEDIKRNIVKFKCRIGLAHTDLFKLAEKNQGGRLDPILDFLCENNLFWEINSNSAYNFFDDIIYNNNNSHVQDLLGRLKGKGVKVSAGSDSHSIYDFEYGRLQEANRIAGMINGY